jgi:tryptophan-rich sensory protein
LHARLIPGARVRSRWWLQLGLNAAWTPVFFGARRTGAAAVVICALLPAVAATAAASARVDRRAGLLYSPYLAWSTYAAALNLEIWRLNRSQWATVSRRFTAAEPALVS